MTIDLDPTFGLGPLTLAWHGVFSVLGLLVGVVATRRLARMRGLDAAPVLEMAIVAALAGLLGARVFYLAQTDPRGILSPLSGGVEGFAFYGSLIAALPAVAAYLALASRPVLPYLDAMALGFPFGMAVGRAGDLINGEHYGPRTDMPWGVTYENVESHVPVAGVAYQSGALYEMGLVLALGIAGLLLQRRLSRPGDALWFILGGYATTRFVVFFWIRDVDPVALGLRQAQWTSLVLLASAVAGAKAARLSQSSPKRARPSSDACPSD